MSAFGHQRISLPHGSFEVASTVDAALVAIVGVQVSWLKRLALTSGVQIAASITALVLITWKQAWKLMLL